MGKPKNTKPLFRIVVPSLGVGIYSLQTSRSVPVAPQLLAAIVHQQSYCKAEVVDGNNYYLWQGLPFGRKKHINHRKLQVTRKAEIVGISCNISYSEPEAFRIIEEYLNLPKGLRPKAILVGGYHASDNEERFLRLGKNSDVIIIVVHGEAETRINPLLLILNNENPLKGLEDSNFPGISYWDGIKIVRTKPRFPKIPEKDLDALPNINYDLAINAKQSVFFIEVLQRGCANKCPFCRVHEMCRRFSTQRSLEKIEAVCRRALFQGKRKVVVFFPCDHVNDNIGYLEELLEGIIRLKERLGVALLLVMQGSVPIGKHTKTLKLMQRAGVIMLCLGFESPIPAELAAMSKPTQEYALEEIIELAHNIQRYVGIHAMMIFGYPVTLHKVAPPVNSRGELMTLLERAQIFWDFIVRVNPESLQLFLHTPLPGTLDRLLLERKGLIFKELGFVYYDGLHSLYQSPDPGVNPLELQEQIIELSRRFYSPSHFWYSRKEFQERIPGEERHRQFLLRRLQGFYLTRMEVKLYNKSGFRDLLAQSVAAREKIMG